MKRITAAILTAIIVLGIVGIAWAIDPVYTTNKRGVRVDPGVVHSTQDVWVAAATVASTGTEPTDLAADERTYQAVLTAIAADASGDGKIATYDVPSKWNAPRFRCIGITDNGTATFIIYAGTRDPRSSTNDCELTVVGQLAFTIGTQASVTSTYEMADTLTVTVTDDWVTDWDSNTATAERVSETSIDLMGADTIVIVPTVASADCKLLIRGY